MSELLMSVFALQVVMVVGLALLALRGPGRLPLRLATLLTAASALLVAALGSAALLGHPKPLRLELRAAPLDGAELLALHLVEDRAIHLWVLEPGATAPRAFLLPWSRALAEQLLAAQQEAERRGGRAELRSGDGPWIEGSEDGELVVHAVPPPPLPPKSVPRPEGRAATSPAG